MTNLSSWQRIAILIGLLIVGLLALLALDPIPQDPNYHLFADTRSLFGIPHFNNVISNAGFAVVGTLGIVAFAGRRRHAIFAQRSDAWPYIVFFVGVALVSLGSAYYHWAPSNDRLLWDRLPMSIAFMAFCSAIIADRIDSKAGNSWLLPVLIGCGIASLVYWDWTESLGRGDLRFYGFVQFYPMIAVPAVCWLFPEHRYTAGRYIVWLIGWYGLSKLLEHFDGEVFGLLGHTISGHTLKHLAATLATLVVLQMLLARRSRRRSETGTVVRFGPAAKRRSEAPESASREDRSDGC
jgi:Ceramidase